MTRIGFHASHEQISPRQLLADVQHAELGFDDLYLHHVGQQQDSFIDTFGEQVLPALNGRS